MGRMSSAPLSVAQRRYLKLVSLSKVQLTTNQVEVTRGLQYSGGSYSRTRWIYPQGPVTIGYGASKQLDIVFDNAVTYQILNVYLTLLNETADPYPLRAPLSLWSNNGFSIINDAAAQNALCAWAVECIDSPVTPP